MKVLLCLCLLVAVSSLVLAEVKDKVRTKNVDLNLAASDKSSVSKPKRDASLLGGSYHGPSYKYLPPSGGASSYDSYAGAHHGLASAGNGHSASFGGVYSSGFGSGYSGPSLSHHSGGGHHGLSSSGLGFGSSGYHGVSSSGLHSSGSSNGLGYGSSSHYSGHGSASHSGGGIKGGANGFSSGPSYSVSSLGNGGYSGGPSYASGHGGYSTSGFGSSSGLGYKTHALSRPSYSGSVGYSGSSAGSNNGYHYSKGSSGSFPSSSSSSSGFGAGAFGSSSHDAHSSDHSDHIHNGEQEHHYVVSGGHSAGFGGAQGASSFGHQGGYSYQGPVQQHPLPSSSYGVPIATVGDAYSTNYHSQQAGVQELGPVYAAGHKGLGHFGFTSNKPQVLHTAISGSSFKQPSYSKAPFKPSAFLGAKYEGSSHNEAPGQQYLPPSGVGADSTGYDYRLPSGPSVAYQESQYQTNVNAQTTPIHEPESSYLPPNNNNEASYNEIPSAPSGSYLPPGQSYSGPYAH